MCLAFIFELCKSVAPTHPPISCSINKKKVQFKIKAQSKKIDKYSYDSALFTGERYDHWNELVKNIYEYALAIAVGLIKSQWNRKEAELLQNSIH